jgi:uncharacterized membrane protein
MDYKTFKKVNGVITAIFAAIIAISVATNNIILAVVSVVVILTVILALKKKVKGVISDERDYANTGKAARMAVSIFSVSGAIIALTLLFMHYEVIGSIIADSVCALMLIQAVFYIYYEKQN